MDQSASRGMTILIRSLVLLLAIEVLVGGGLAVQRALRPEPPAPDFAKVDPETRNELERLRMAARNGSSLEWRLLADALLGYGYYDAAGECFARAAELNPRDARPVYGRGFCLERVGRIAEANTILEQAASIADDDLRRTCWYQIGRNHLRVDEVDRAEAAFLRIRGFPPADIQRARILVRSDRAAEALPIIERLLEQAPNELRVIQLQRRAAEALDRADLARTARDRESRAEITLTLEYSLELIGMLQAGFGMGRRLAHCLEVRDRGTLDDQRRVLNDALDIIRPAGLWNYRRVFLAGAMVELASNQVDAAEQLVNEVERMTQVDAETVELRGHIAQARGDMRNAVRLWKLAAGLRPSEQICLLLAEALRGESPAESRHFQALGSLQKGLDLFRRNRLDEARPLLARAVELDPQLAWGWYYRGELERLAGRLNPARQAYRQALELDPDNGRALDRLAEIAAAAEGSSGQPSRPPETGT